MVTDLLPEPKVKVVFPMVPLVVAMRHAAVEVPRMSLWCTYALTEVMRQEIPPLTLIVRGVWVVLAGHAGGVTAPAGTLALVEVHVPSDVGVHAPPIGSVAVRVQVLKGSQNA
jgi:hypothetical protein